MRAADASHYTITDYASTRIIIYMSLAFREISFVLAKSIWAAMQDILRTCLPQENPM